MTGSGVPKEAEAAVRPADGRDGRASPAGEPAVLEARSLVRRYVGGDGRPIEVLAGVDLTVRRGEMVAIVGVSGAGKSTLLHLLGGLDRPDAGEVRIAGRPTTGLPDAELTELRNRSIGFVFQFHHLLRDFTAVENVEMPLRIAGWPEGRGRERAAGLLAQVGLSARLHHRPGALSGGEQQRVAVARALAAEPAVLLADEPTGNLDWHHAEALHEMFGGLARDHGLGLVVVTHNRSLAARADRILHLVDGRLVDSSGVGSGVA
jgi:lipoprotein-releasing system ATP-binding protein